MPTNPIDEFTKRVSEALRNSPLQDAEKNLKVLIAGFLERFDVVPREDFEIQRHLLEKALARLSELEARVAALESNNPSDTPP